MPILQTKNLPHINAIDIRGLTKRFDGVKAIDGLSMDIEKGKITGIIGPNGSGKTTLVNLLSCMIGIDGGMIIVDDALELSNIKPYDILAYGITRTFQEARLFNQMTVLDNVLAVLTERNVFGALFEKHNDYHLGKAKEALEKVSQSGLWIVVKALTNSKSQVPGSVSGIFYKIMVKLTKYLKHIHTKKSR